MGSAGWLGRAGRGKLDEANRQLTKQLKQILHNKNNLNTETDTNQTTRKLT